MTALPTTDEVAPPFDECVDQAFSRYVETVVSDQDAFTREERIDRLHVCIIASQMAVRLQLGQDELPFEHHTRDYFLARVRQESGMPYHLGHRELANKLFKTATIEANARLSDKVGEAQSPATPEVFGALLRLLLADGTVLRTKAEVIRPRQ